MQDMHPATRAAETQYEAREGISVQTIGKNDQMDKGSMAQHRDSARGKATVSPPKTPPNPTAPPYDEPEDPAKPFLCKFEGCERANIEHGF